MKKYTVNTPEGTRDLLFSDCRKLRRAEAAVCSLFQRRGYSEAVTPAVEYYDMFLKLGTPMPEESIMKMVDRSGKIIVLRPDCTSPIVRVAATKLRSYVFPVRLYYDQTVFRSDAAHLGSKSEFTQCGIELVGASGIKADLEVIMLAVEAIRSCGIEKFNIELGHAGFFRELVSSLGADQEQAELIRGMIEIKNYAAIGELLEPFSHKAECRSLLKLGGLFGGAEVLDEALKLPASDEAQKSILYLKEIYECLKAARMDGYICFDLGLLHQIDYYTGVVFRGYAEGAGGVVLTGGRYDNLFDSFGQSEPATGFAINMELLTRCIDDEPDIIRKAMVFCNTEQLEYASSVVERSPEQLEISPFSTLEETMESARKKGMSRIIDITSGEETEVPL